MSKLQSVISVSRVIILSPRAHVPACVRSTQERHIGDVSQMVAGCASYLKALCPTLGHKNSALAPSPRPTSHTSLPHPTPGGKASHCCYQLSIFFLTPPSQLTPICNPQIS